jgi:hypothetical protein
MSVEPFGEKQDALLLARGTKQPAFAGISEDGLIAAIIAAKTSKTSVQVSAIQILAHHLADNGVPSAVLLLIPIVVDALELLVIVLDQRIQRTCARVSGLVNGSRCVLHALHNRQGL